MVSVSWLDYDDKELVPGVVPGDRPSKGGFWDGFGRDLGFDLLADRKWELSNPWPAEASRCIRSSPVVGRDAVLVKVRASGAQVAAVAVTIISTVVWGGSSSGHWITYRKK